MKIARLVDWLSPTLTDLGLAAPYAAVRKARKVEPDLDDGTATLPLLLLHPWKEAAGANPYDNHVRHEVFERFACVTVCAEDDLEDHRQHLFDALLGQVPPDYTDDVQYIEGEVLDLNMTTIWWRDIFEMKRLRSQA